MPTASVLLRVSALTVLHRAVADLTLQVWPNAAFAPPAAARLTTPPNVVLPPALPDYSSLRFTGTITGAATELINFTASSDGGVRLWVDDRLVIDRGGVHGDGPRPRPAFLRVPFIAGVSQPFRLEYTRWAGGGAPALELRWAGSVTTERVVPASAFAPLASAPEGERVALRDRLVNPAVAWQTFRNPSMGSHVLMPSGFVVDATLVDVATGATLGPVIVFRRSNPALARAGLHSPNGSDYTQLRWRRGAQTCASSRPPTAATAPTSRSWSGR